MRSHVFDSICHFKKINERKRKKSIIIGSFRSIDYFFLKKKHRFFRLFFEFTTVKKSFNQFLRHVIRSKMSENCDQN